MCSLCWPYQSQLQYKHLTQLAIAQLKAFLLQLGHIVQR
jgi:hypothetical protein